MLFKRRFHDGIRDGSLTLTFRFWRHARVRPGGRYRFGAGEVLEVDSVEAVELGSIGDREARRAGFPSAAELRRELERGARRRLAPDEGVCRVSFHYVGERADPRAALREDVGEAALAEVRRKLERMDRRSRRGEWTRSMLSLIAARPRTAASRLAAEAGREVPAFKADVRKLKALGLTVSYEIGYELSPRGRALLAALDSD